MVVYIVTHAKQQIYELKI